MKKFFIGFGLFLGIVLSLVGALPARASSEAINNLSQQVIVSQDSVATITETIDYDFGTSSRHGIERYYQLSSKNPDSKYYNLNFELLGVTQDGEPAQFIDNRSGNSYYVRVGDANTRISGLHRYVLSYKMWPVVRQDPAGDYINYDVTGNSWQVPILKANATVTVPVGLVASHQRCYSGSTQSTSQDCTVSAVANTVTVATNSSLSSGQGLTLNFLTPSGSFSQYLTPSDKPIAPEPVNPIWRYLISFGLGLLIICIGVGARLIQWVHKRKSEKAETIIAQYSPPDGLLPAEMGVLEDMKLTMTEVTATIIDLAVKGYLKIHKLDGSKDYEFILVKEDLTDLQDYEQVLMTLFISSATDTNGVKAVNITKLDKSQASSSINSVYNKIDSRLRGKNYYKKKIQGGAKAGGVVGIIVLVFVIPFVFGFLSILWVIFPFLCIIIALAIANMPGHLTSTGFDEWAKVEGLKLYLTVAEKDRINFTDAPKMNPQLFNKLLPSAIALGVEKEWAKQFEGMDISKSTGWYDDPNPITSIYIATAISSSFNNSLASSFAPPSSSGTGSSSGDFSGGGFSGGGSFGGGGGGSW